MGIFEDMVRVINQRRVHETENTRAITSIFSEKPSLKPAMVLHGFKLIEELVGSENGCFGGPLYRLCDVGVRSGRWAAFPLIPHHLNRIGISEDQLRSQADSFRGMAMNKPYVIEMVSGGVSVFSPNYQLVAMAVGAGCVHWMRANAKDPVFAENVERRLGPNWLKEL